VCVRLLIYFVFNVISLNPESAIAQHLQLFFVLFLDFKAWDLWISDRGSDLVDPLLDDVSSMHVALRYVNIALLCVQEGAADRPTMSDVVAMLSNESAALPYPKQPGFWNLRSVGKPNPTSSGPEICSVNNATVSIMEGR
jgi:hypothetical protein